MAAERSGVGSPPAPDPYPLDRLGAGAEIDGFRLEERLHQGGMASLWRVSCVGSLPAFAGPQDLLPMIMKVPLIRRGQDPATIVGFEVEQMIMPTLSGPHVPRFVARGDFSRQPYIVMEHLPGDTLKPRLDRSPLPLDEVTEIGAQVAAALHDLHRQHVVHLDVKPSNILFRETGEAVLIDFGLSRHDHLPDLLDEEFMLPMGTGPYMSPEQIRYIRNDPRSDLFALGVMLYHLTTGQRPFGAPTSLAGLRKRLFMDPVPPRAWRSDCPPWLQEIILKCLEVQPEKRYQSASQLLLDLQNPTQVALTKRSERLQRLGRIARAKQWFFSLGQQNEERPVHATMQVSRAPIILVAVDVEHAPPALLDAMREAVFHLVQAEPDARLACLVVRRSSIIGTDDVVDTAGRSEHLRLSVQLRHWAHPLRQMLQLAEGRLTFHVLDSNDTADAVVDFARRNRVDHLVIGASGRSTLRKVLGSTAATVVTETDCTVTVVRGAVTPPTA